MARITVDDCLIRVPDRFELALLAVERARQIGDGAAVTIDVKDEPKTVVALREIAAGTVDPEALRAGLVDRLRRYRPDEGPVEGDELDPEVLAALARSDERSAGIPDDTFGDEGEPVEVG